MDAPEGAPTRLILVRHGATTHSPERRYSGRNDLALSDVGEQQAAALARRMPSFGPVAAVISSPLRRTRQTAAAIGAALNCAVTESAGLIETDFGDWEGLTGDEVRERWPAEYAAWLEGPESAPPGGEAFSAVARRARRARDEIIAAHPGATVIAVTHVTPIKVLLMLALDAPLMSMFRLHLDTAGISIANYFPNGISSVRLVNDTGHLSG